MTAPADWRQPALAVAGDVSWGAQALLRSPLDALLTASRPPGSPWRSRRRCRSGVFAGAPSQRVGAAAMRCAGGAMAVALLVGFHVLLRSAVGRWLVQRPPTVAAAAASSAGSLCWAGIVIGHAAVVWLAALAVAAVRGPVARDLAAAPGDRRCSSLAGRLPALLSAAPGLARRAWQSPKPGRRRNCSCSRWRGRCCAGSAGSATRPTGSAHGVRGRRGRARAALYPALWSAAERARERLVEGTTRCRR